MPDTETKRYRLILEDITEERSSPHGTVRTITRLKGLGSEVKARVFILDMRTALDHVLVQELMGQGIDESTARALVGA